jgi:hypothetical protein
LWLAQRFGWRSRSPHFRSQGHVIGRFAPFQYIVVNKAFPGSLTKINFDL